MKLFRKLHGRLVPPGMEVEILRRLPRITLVGLLIPVAMAILVRAMPAEPGVDVTKHVMTVDIFAIAVTITFLTAVFTVAIGCVVVHVMKGPAYVADSYPVSHADRPASKHASVEADSVAEMHRQNQEDDRQREDLQ
jgi:hypothetical protein